MKENEVVEKNDQLTVMAQPHMRLIELAVQNGSDITYLEKLLDLQERHEANQARKDFNGAMSKFQGLLPVIEKNGIVDYTSPKGRTFYDYAKLEDIAKAIRPALKETGISYRFTQSQDQGWITVVCIVTHVSGHFELSQLTSQPDVSGGKDPLKAIASTISYLRRYTLTGSLGIVVGGEDDDGGSFDPLSVAEKEGEQVLLTEDQYNQREKSWIKAVKKGSTTVQDILDQLNSNGHFLTENQLAGLTEKCNENS